MVLLRIPGYLIGFVFCIIVLPIQLLCLFIFEFICAHLFTFIFRCIGSPFVIVYSAYFNRNSWPNYLSNWRKVHDDVKPDWEGPFRRFQKLNKWFVEGPGS